MTRALTILSLACLLIASAAAASILLRESIPQAGRQAVSPMKVGAVVPNRESKQDRLTVASVAPASFEPPSGASSNEPLRQAFASSSDADLEAARAEAATLVAPSLPPSAPPKPKLAAKPQLQPQKPYTLLSDKQIAGIKERLNLSSAQEYYWPAVETALRAVARKVHATRQADPKAAAAQIDPDSAEVQQLKSAAMPLLFQLREDQKEEVRKLARIIGLDKVAAAI